jgi:hypothetical protein
MARGGGGGGGHGGGGGSHASGGFGGGMGHFGGGFGGGFAAGSAVHSGAVAGRMGNFGTVARTARVGTRFDHRRIGAQWWGNPCGYNEYYYQNNPNYTWCTD